LRKANPDGQNIRPLTDGTADYFPRFTPDGKNVIFQRDSIFAAVWRVSADGSEPAIKIIEPLASHAAVSPDGKIIAYHSMQRGEGKPRWKMALTETETGKTINKLDFPIPISQRNTLWHPNGKFLTMIFNNGENVGLLLFSPTDGKYQTIDNISKNKITSFAWSPDGNQFAFSHITEIRDVVSLGRF
jgi:Tol biopolymer transport system component